MFDLGRTSPSNVILMEFKRRWGTSIANLPQLYYPDEIGKRLTVRERSMSYKLISTICSKAPDSALKTFGKLCYRHLC